MKKYNDFIRLYHCLALNIDFKIMNAPMTIAKHIIIKLKFFKKTFKLSEN